MAGSLNHIVNENGAFTMRNIENMGDAHEALEECFDIIAELLNTGISNIDRDHDTEGWMKEVCKRCKAPLPKMRPYKGAREKDGEA